MKHFISLSLSLSQYTHTYIYIYIYLNSVGSASTVSGDCPSYHASECGSAFPSCPNQQYIKGYRLHRNNLVWWLHRQETESPKAPLTLIYIYTSPSGKCRKGIKVSSILSGVWQVWIQSCSSFWPVTIPMLKSRICPTIWPKLVGE